MSNYNRQDDWMETYKSLVTLSTEGFKYFILVNGGAAVAILAYLGSIAGKGGSVPDMRYAMALFLFGLLSCGVAMVFAYLTQLQRLNRLAVQQTTDRDWRLVVAIIFACLSLIAFAIGSWLAVVAFK